MVGKVEVKEGYKKTEVGIIPEDWELIKLGDFIEYTKGYAFKSSNYTKNGIRVIRVSDTDYDSVKDSEEIYIDNRDYKKYEKWSLSENDIILSTVGSKPPMYDSMVGKAIRVDLKNACSLLNQNAVRILSKNKKFASQLLIYYNLKTKRYMTHIEKIFRGNANQASITLVELFEFEIPIPREDNEQKSISAALSDTDNFIHSLEKLIGKKKKIKQGTMQQLLTGKKRLPGYSGDWEVKKLGELYDISAGGDLDINNYSDFMTEKYKYPIYSNGITNKGIYGYSPYSTHIGNSVTVTARGTIGNANYREENYCAIGRLLVLKSKFLIENYMISELINECLEFTHESTGVPQLTSPQISKYDVYLPIDYNEQIAIAKILSDMDSEIKSLQQKLEKYKTIKQGMMQELLTGRIRLI